MIPQAIFIEAGHGKNAFGLADCGAVGRLGEKVYKERDFNKDVAGRLVQRLLNNEGLKNTLLQGVGIETDASALKKMNYVNMVMRENRLTPLRCLGISIHMNSSVSSKPKGVEVWHQKKGLHPKKLAETIIGAWKNWVKIPLRPRPVNNTKDHWKFHRLYIDDAYCPFVLVEVGFISNFFDLSVIQRYPDEIAKILEQGVLEYLKLD